MRPATPPAAPPPRGPPRLACPRWAPALALAAVAGPVAAALLLALVALWTALSLLLGSVHVSSTLCLGVLVGLAVATGVGEDAGSYARAVVDVSVVSAALVALVYGAWLARVRRVAALAAAAAAAAFAYAVGKGASVPRPLTGAEVAAVAVAALLPAVQAVAAARLWRPASEARCRAAEARLLAATLRAPYRTADAAGVHAIVVDGGGGRGGGPRPPAIVLLHGYAAGAVWWLRNIAELAAATGATVYAIDLLGSGSSARPRFRARTVEDAETFFIASIEAWAAAQGDPALRRPFVLVGHSLGGYLAAAFALRRPDAVAHLVLVSPAGIPGAGGPAAAAAAAAAAADAGPPGADRDDDSGDGGSDDAPVAAAAAAARLPRGLPRAGGWLWAVVAWAWDHDVTPGVMLRAAGPLGPWIARAGLARRASRWTLEYDFTPAQLAALGDWMYASVAGEGSGEFALRQLLAPGAWARQPMGARLVAAARAGGGGGGGGGGSGGSGPRLACPVTMLYGSTHDWMSAEAGHATAAALRAEGVDATCTELGPAGHHVYLEACGAFNDFVASEIARCRR